MAVMSFWARGDSGSANNPEINAQNTNVTPVTQLTFSSGTSGDLILEYGVGGGVDPDTQVSIDGGVTYQDFTLIFSGNLDTHPKLSNINGIDFRTAFVTVIEVNGQRYFFFPTLQPDAATMGDFPNGKTGLDGLPDTTDPVPVCFARSTRILTPEGYRKVEDLVAGDVVSTWDNGPQEIRWIGSTRVSAQGKFMPVRFAAGALGGGVPEHALVVSPLHRILLSGRQAELLFGDGEVLVAAQHLINDHTIRRADDMDSVEYFHLLFDSHQIVIAEGVPCESLHPGKVALASMGGAARGEVLELFPGLGDDAAEYGPTARPSLKAYEADLLVRTLNR